MRTHPGPAETSNPFTDPISRRSVRNFAAAVSAVTALLYALIGVGILVVVEPGTSDQGDMLAFGLPAAGAFLVGALLLVLFDNRLLWLLGAILQVIVLVGYVAMAGIRTPQFELWGILIKLTQLVLFFALAFLVLRSPEEELERDETA